MNVSKIVIIAVLVLMFLVGCNTSGTKEKKQFVGTEIPTVQPNEQTQDTVFYNNTNKINTNSSQDITPEIKNNQTIQIQTNNSTQIIKPKIKSIARVTIKSLPDINLNSHDFTYSAKQVESQTRYLNNDELKKYDVTGFYIKEGHISTFNYDEDSNYDNPTDFVTATVIRYETDYINDLIANKKLDNNTFGKQKFNVSIGEYNVGYYEFPQKNMFTSVNTIEFVKYDIYVKVIDASKEGIIVKKDETTKYARAIEARITK